MKIMKLMLVLLLMGIGVAEAKELTLTSDNSLLLYGVIDGQTSAEVQYRAKELDSKLPSGDALYVVLATPGGSIQDGLEMIEGLKSLNRPVHTITIFAASMGFHTAQGLGTRYITHFGTLMAHKARGGFAGEFPGQIDSRYVYYIKRLNEMDRITASRTNGKLTTKTLQELYANEYWVDGFEATSKGLADEVVTVKCDHSLNGTRNQIINFMGFSFNVQFSKCPMNLGPVAVETMIQTDQGLIELKTFLARGGSLSKCTGYGCDRDSSILGPMVVVPRANVEGLTLEKINQELDNLKKTTKVNRNVIVKE